MPFASTALAARIERAEARLSESIGRAVQAQEADALVEPLAGGIVVYTGPDSPMNKMIGVGFEPGPDDDQLQAVEVQFTKRQTALQAEVATLADAALLARLARRGYILQGFENVLGRALAYQDGIEDPDHRITTELLGEKGDAHWLDVAITGFSQADSQGVHAEPLPPREVLERALEPFTNVPGFRRYLARLDDQVVGIATLRLDAGLAQLCGAATLLPFRRRGVQSALLRRRLADAFANGCDLALMTTQPGSKSQENGERQGFALLYSRAILVKPPD